MEHLLANHFEATRKAMGLRLSELAASAGYRNASKFARRWWTFQHTGQAPPFFVAGVARSLDVDRQTLRQIVEQERRQFVAEWNAKAKFFRRLIEVVAFMALVYREFLPPHMTLAEAEIYASHIAVEPRKFILLRWSPRLTIVFDNRGRLIERRLAMPDDDMPLYLRAVNLPKLFSRGQA